MRVSDEGRVVHEAGLTDLKQVAQSWLAAAGDTKVWLFYGEMGAGKTTLIKAICRELGVEEVMASPTFAIVNEYPGAGGSRVFHFDFYRIGSETEAYDIGTEDYFYSGDYCFVEWPEKIPSLIPPVRAEVHIVPENQTKRTLSLSVHDGQKENRI